MSASGSSAVAQTATDPQSINQNEDNEFSVIKIDPAVKMATENVKSDDAALAEVEPGHGAQVVKVLEDHSYSLDVAELEHVLLRDQYRGLPVAVVSVAGAYRGGKSFLLNFFLRYLTSPESKRKDGSWLGDDNAPLEGFSWRGGSVRNTTGILMWSEPALIELPNGGKVAVLLMDTQGTFDNESTVRDCSTIFALSTLLSSVQIFNLSMNIKEDDMQHLQLFTEYGKLARSEGTTKPFQVLEFLVRDWQYPWEFSYGAEGGEQLLQSKLKVHDKTPEEIKELRSQLYQSFETITAFLMPHPGFQVSNPKFKGVNKDIMPEFKNQLIQLVASLFSPEKIKIKTVNGEQVTTRDLFTYFKTYMELFNSDTVPSPKNIMEATVTAALLNATNEARDSYSRGMDEECGAGRPSLPAPDLRALHAARLGAATRAFHAKKKMGSADQANHCLEDLIKDLNDRFPQIEMNNLAKLQMTNKKAKEEYESIVQHVSRGKLLCLHPLDLEQVNQNAFKAAMKIYDANRRVISTDKKDEDRTKLEQNLEELYTKTKLTNELNNNMVVTEVCSQYNSSMEQKCGLKPPLREDAFKREHETALQTAQESFNAKRNLPNSYPEDIYKQKLVAEIKSIFSNLNDLNNSNYNATALAMRRNAMNQARQLYEKEMQAECGSPTLSSPEGDVASLHRNTLNKAKAAFAANITMGTPEESNEYLQELIKELGERFPQYQQNNKSKLLTTIKKSEDEYNKTVHNISKDQPLCLHALDLDKLHKDSVKAALKLFDSNRKLIYSKTDDDRSKFEESFKETFRKLQKTNEQNNNTMITELRAEYSKHMQSKCSLDPPMPEQDFKREHEVALKKAQDSFDLKRNKPNAYPQDTFKLILTTEINSIYHQLNTVNLSNFNSTALAAMRRVMNESRQLYDTKMMTECGSQTISMPAEDLDTLHHKYLDEAKQHFTKNVTMTQQEETKKHLEELIRELNGRLLMYQQYNTSKLHAAGKKALELYDEWISKLTNDKPICLHPADLQKGHEDGAKAALQHFTANRKKLTNNTDEAVTHLNGVLSKRFDLLKIHNESNNVTLVKDIQTEYWKKMETNCNRIPPYSDAEFKLQHDQELKLALNEFQAKRNTPSSHDQDFYKNSLEEKIANTYKEFNNINISHRLEKERLKAEREQNKEEQERLRKEQEYARELQQSFTKIHEQELEQRERERLEREATLNTLKEQLASEQQIYKQQQEEMTERFNDYRNSQQSEIQRLSNQTVELQNMINQLSRQPSSDSGCIIL